MSYSPEGFKSQHTIPLHLAASSTPSLRRSKLPSSQYEYLSSHWSANKQSAFTLENKWFTKFKSRSPKFLISKRRFKLLKVKAEFRHVQECGRNNGLDILVMSLVGSEVS
jgi:hypothetical protein